MSYFVYQFEAVSIQDYVLAGGKIKTMVGASELLEAITNTLLEETIDALGLTTIEIDNLSNEGNLELKPEQAVFPRRAGSVFLMVTQNQDKAEKFSELWPILVSNFAPGLKFSATLKSGKSYNEATKAVRNELNNQKNQPQTQLPESTPLTLRFQKTGLAQVKAPSNKQDGQDWTMPAKTSRLFNSLAAKHIDAEKLKQFSFPEKFEHKEIDPKAFPFKSQNPGNHSVAIIHTDGNGLGGYLQKIFSNLEAETSSAKSIKAYAQFSLGLDKATQDAAKQATNWLINQYQREREAPPHNESSANETLPLPMRPLILGGDDLTCIVRADYALGFIQAFTRAFEQATTAFVAKLKQDFKQIFDDLPKTLTCTTGMLFLKSNQPFSLGYALAEELCSKAKKEGQRLSKDSQSKMPPSLLNFLHSTNTLFDQLEIQIKQELQTPNKMLSVMPYAFSENNSRPQISQLFALASNFDANDKTKLNPSAIRNYAGHLHQDSHYAETFWNRWENQSSGKESPVESSWMKFKGQYEGLTFKTEDLSFKTEDSSFDEAIPIADLITLFSLEMINPIQNLQGDNQ